MVEYWTLIKEYPLYEVSNLGNVRRKSTGRLMKKCIRNGHKQNHRYFFAKIGKNKNKGIMIEQVVWQYFANYGEPCDYSGKKVFRHRNGNIDDCSLSNLYLEDDKRGFYGKRERERVVSQDEIDDYWKQGQLMITKIYNKYFRGKYHTYIKSHIEDLLDEAFIKTYEKLGNGKSLCLNLYSSLLGVIKQFCRGKRRECLIDDSRTMDYLDKEYRELR